MDKNQKISESMKGNTNAEKWDFDTAEKFMQKALKLSKDKDYDFIGEVAYDLNETKNTFDYIADKFELLAHYKKQIKFNCEVNCFRNIKTENINTAAGIMNLKSNHGWTDRLKTENTNSNVNILSIDPLSDASDDNPA
tara:strand:- start:244 stop:657 length:414 start_codon:yes stop_codon:yes gene_type:complete